MIDQEIVNFIGILMLISALAVQIRSYVRPMIDTLIIQSLLLAAIATYLGVATSNLLLLLLAALIVLLRGFLLTFILGRRLPKDHKFIREYSTGTGVALLFSVIVFIASFIVYKLVFYPAVGHPDGAIALSLITQGMLLIMTRRNSFAHFIGFVEEENGIVLMSLSVISLPLVIEINILLDVLALVVAGAVLIHEKIEHVPVLELMG
jgi:hydrogenase-4 component E